MPTFMNQETAAAGPPRRKTYRYGEKNPYAMTGGLSPLPSMSSAGGATPGPATPTTRRMQPLMGPTPGAGVTYRGAGSYGAGGFGESAALAGVTGAAEENPRTEQYWQDVGNIRGVEATREGQRTDLMTKAAAALTPGAGQMYTMPAGYWEDRAREATGALTAQWQQGLADLDNKLRRKMIDKPTYDAAVADLNARMRSSVAGVKADTRKQSLEFGAGQAGAAASGLTGLMGQVPSSTYNVSQPEESTAAQRALSSLGLGQARGGNVMSPQERLLAGFGLTEDQGKYHEVRRVALPGGRFTTRIVPRST